MKIEIEQVIDGKWGKAGKEIKDGDRMKMLDAGQVSDSGFKDKEGNPTKQYIFKIMLTSKEEYNINMNRTSRNTLARGFGTDTDLWKGKIIKAFVVRQMVGDSLKNVLYLAPDGWIMTDDGEFTPELDESQKIDAALDENYPDKPEVTIEDSPF